jgi:hypothetical protein
VADDRLTCAAAQAMAPDLALGVLEGTERGEALAHVARCSACRAHVQGLADVVDRLLAVAPEAEPPAGFESAVIERIAEEGERRTSGRRHRRRVAAFAAAAVVLLLLGLGAGLAVGAGDGANGSDGSTLATASMESPAGEQVGEVWRYGDDGDAVVFVSVPAWADVDVVEPMGRRYTLRLELEGGDTVEVGDFALGGGVSSWGVSTRVDSAQIVAVSVVDDTGHVWCTGHFA